MNITTIITQLVTGQEGKIQAINIGKLNNIMGIQIIQDSNKKTTKSSSKVKEFV